MMPNVQEAGESRESLRRFYAEKAGAVAAQVAALKQKSHRILMGEIALFLLSIFFLVFYTVKDGNILPLGLAVLALVCYVFMRAKDAKNDADLQAAKALLEVYRREQAYMKNDFSVFGDGSNYLDVHHPFALDLDIFGPASLFNRLNRTVTTGGSDVLAYWLSSLNDASGRFVTVDELARREHFRAQFMAHGMAEQIDTQQVTTALDGIWNLQVPTFPQNKLAAGLAWLFVIGLWGLIAASAFGVVSASLPIWWAIFQFFLQFFLFNASLRKFGQKADKLHLSTKAYLRLIRLSRSLEPHSEELRAIIGQVRKASDAFEGLGKLLDGLDRRGNVLGLMLMDTLFLGDFFLMRKLLLWQRNNKANIASGILALSQLDALVSMATFRFDEPCSIRPTMVDKEGVFYAAEGLWHPFLNDKAVRNDFLIRDNHFYIITGANMAGKSTFLRVIGINYLLAMCGLPVFAASLSVSAFSLFTSMRTTDDLTHGISYFNAELLRLRQLIDYSNQHAHTLIILDEILKGTNSLDKLNGSRLFLEYIAQRPVTGVIATHDLELSKMETTHENRFHNYCFEIELGSDIVYSYKIKAGVAHNQNATYLLKKILSGGEQK